MRMRQVGGMIRQRKVQRPEAMLLVLAAGGRSRPCLPVDALDLGPPLRRPILLQLMVEPPRRRGYRLGTARRSSSRSALLGLRQMRQTVETRQQEGEGREGTTWLSITRVA